MSQSVSVADLTTADESPDQNVDVSGDSNDEHRIPTTDYEKGKLIIRSI